MQDEVDSLNERIQEGTGELRDIRVARRAALEDEENAVRFAVLGWMPTLVLILGLVLYLRRTRQERHAQARSLTMSTNAKLAALAALLLAGSVWAYANSTSRGDRFQRGQLLLPNLIPDEVATITIAQANEVTTLHRRGDAFLVSETYDYPARNESVNRLLRDLLQIELEKEVGRGVGLAAELEIDPPTDETVDVTLMNSTEQEMVHLRIGKSVSDGTGRYVQRLDVESASIYLTTAGVFLSTGSSAYLQKEVVDHSQDEVQRVLGSDFEMAVEDTGARCAS